MVLAFERWGCADIAAPGCAGILGDFRWSPRDLLEEKPGGAKGYGTAAPLVLEFERFQVEPKRSS